LKGGSFGTANRALVPVVVVAVDVVVVVVVVVVVGDARTVIILPCFTPNDVSGWDSSEFLIHYSIVHENTRFGDRTKRLSI
jgi:hypothetical protein